MLLVIALLCVGLLLHMLNSGTHPGTKVHERSQKATGVWLLFIGVPFLLFVFLGATFVSSTTGEHFNLAEEAVTTVNDIGAEWQQRMAAGEIRR